MLDISPTRIMFGKTDQAFATAYYHWFFLIQPFDLPERLIGADPLYYLRKKTGGWGSAANIFDPRALAEYERCFAIPATIHATCEDYRAAASIDLEHDDADVAAGRKVTCPLLVLWGDEGRRPPLFRSARGLARPSRATCAAAPAVRPLPRRRSAGGDAGRVPRILLLEARLQRAGLRERRFF